MKKVNKNFDFSWQFKNYGIHTVHTEWGNKDSPVRKDCPIELVRYFDDSHSSCYTIADWALDDEGYELRFVGNRPFVDIEPEEMASIWKQLRAAQKMLDEYFKANEDDEEEFGY